MFNCTNNCLEKDSNYSKPMPWIGLYIAAASLCCAILVSMDFATAVRRKQPWIPSRYFALNASTLTVLAVAIKLSVDINTAMPGREDQLAKLSSSAFICVSMCHFIPSLGKMGDTELIANLIALVILVITSVVNLWIQLNTGVIYAFMELHIIYLASMVYLLMVCCCTAIALASIKNELRVMFHSKNQVAKDEFENVNGSTTTNKRLERYLVKFSIMSHTGWPHFVLGRSRLYGASAFICIIDTTCMQIFTVIYQLRILPFQSQSQSNQGTFCGDEKSDYEWSTSLVLLAQFIASFFGFFVVILKFLFLPKPEHFRIQPMIKNLITVERHWIQLLIEIRRRPFFFYIRYKGCRKFVYHAKNTFINFLTAVQIATVVMVKFIGFIYGIGLWLITKLGCILFPTHNPNILHPHLTFLSITNPSELEQLEQYVLHVKGEEDRIKSILKFALYATSKYIQEGKREEPTDLLDFLRNRHSPGFSGVFLFDSNRVPHSYFNGTPSNCWSLSVVTLTSLAVLLPDTDQCRVKDLLKAVGEGLVFVKKIEENLNDHIRFKNKRKAADSVWEDLDIHGRRLDIDPKELASKGNNPIIILRFIADSAKNTFEALDPSKDNCSVWPIEAAASYCLHMACESVLLDCEDPNSQFQTTDALFEMLSSRICDILGACLTNLESSILKECSDSTIENMNEAARQTLIVFGKSEKIMELLDGGEIPKLGAFIDEWRSPSGA